MPTRNHGCTALAYISRHSGALAGKALLKRTFNGDVFMQISGLPIAWARPPLNSADTLAGAEPGAAGAIPAAAAGSSRAPGLKSSPLPFDSMLDALLNMQSLTAPLVLGADGKPDMRASVIAGIGSASRGGPSDGFGGIQILSDSDDGASDAFSLSGLSSAQVADNLIEQAGRNGVLSVSDVLDKMGVDRSQSAGKAVAEGIEVAWTRLNHGQSGPISAADLAAAIQGYRAANGDAVSAGGTAWRG